MDVDKLTQFLRNKIKTGALDNTALLNMKELSERPTTTQHALENLIEDYSIRIRTNRHKIASNTVLSKVRELGTLNQRLDKRLQAHIKMLRRNEGSLAGTTDVLKFDSAKNRSDRLIEVINAKNTWTTALRAADMMDESEQNELYGYLVSLQQANQILTKYVPCQRREQLLESRKDLFFGWFSSAILFAIDGNDVNQLVMLKEKFDALGRATAYKKMFAEYVKNKISTFMTEKQDEMTLWMLLSEWFLVWKQIFKMAEQLLGGDGSQYIAQSCYEGIRTKDDMIMALLVKLMTNSENIFSAVHEVSNVRKDFLDYVKSDGDQAVMKVAIQLCDDLYEMISDDYSKHVKSLLYTKIDKIAQMANEKSPKKHDWVPPLLEEVFATYRDIVNEAASTFGVGFSKYIVTSFEKSVDQLNSTFRKSNVLTQKSVSTESALHPLASSATVEEMSDKLICICAAGYLINMINDTNAFIQETHLSLRSNNDHHEPYLIKNRNQLERLAKKVVQEKVNELAASFIDPMTHEMQTLKQSVNTNDSMDMLKLSLPNFSVTAHNYITSVGHSLLNQMNNIGAYNTDRNFRTAVASVSGENFNEEECDLWVLRGIVALLMSRFVQNVGEVSKLPLKVAKQFSADIVFLMEALQDMRVEPSKNLSVLAEELGRVTNVR